MAKPEENVDWRAIIQEQQRLDSLRVPGEIDWDAIMRAQHPEKYGPPRPIDIRPLSVKQYECFGCVVDPIGVTIGNFFRSLFGLPLKPTNEDLLIQAYQEEYEHQIDLYNKFYEEEVGPYHEDSGIS